MMDEEFIPIIGFEGLYEINRLGMIKSLQREEITMNGRKRILKEKILKPGLRSEYLSVALTKNFKSKSFYIHLLVAKHFIDNPKNKQTVNHKDRNKTNNKADNLEWLTYSENAKHSFTIGNHKTKTKVHQYSIEGVFIKSWDYIGLAANHYGISGGAICLVCAGKNKTAAGFIWRHKL